MGCNRMTAGQTAGRMANRDDAPSSAGSALGSQMSPYRSKSWLGRRSPPALLVETLRSSLLLCADPRPAVVGCVVGW